MRYIYLFFLTLSLTFTSYAQNDLIGEWYLHYIEVDGEQIYSTIPNSFNNIIFDTDGFNGAVCNNGYGGDYTVIDESTLHVTNFGYFAGTCNYLNESILFLSPYLSIFEIPFESNIFNYLISGTGNDETLQLTNSENNLAFYGRMPLPENNLPGIWYLHSTTLNDVEEINTYDPNFYIQFTVDAGSFMSLDYDGSGVCNNYEGEYHLEGLDELKILHFGATLAICGNSGGFFEQSYFLFFSETSSNSTLLSYSVSGSGDDETLVLTDVNGDFVTYGRQTLSIEENIIPDLNIRITENPVKSELMLDISEELGSRIQYQIFSVDGKKIVDGLILENKQIDVNNLSAGVYLMQVSFEHHSSQIIKFIKY